jgi:allophanate hydrolase subunit 2
MSLRLLEPGLCTLVVDGGRPSSRSLGVPVGGAADRFALAIGNGLVGNAAEAAALEISLLGPTLAADCDLACVLNGAPFEMKLEGHGRLSAGKTFTLPAAKKLHVGGTHSGMRAYFCVTGGIKGAPILGSSSSLTPLRKDAELTCATGTIGSHFIDPAFEWNRDPLLLHAVRGVQSHLFAFAEFQGQEYEITSTANRMGIRLRAQPLSWEKVELLSEPVCPGTIQVTRDGQCIILGVDGQTIGGYPKIAQVISADLDKLGQLRPGDGIRFQEVDLEEARSLYLRKQAELYEWLTRLLC